MIPVETVFVYMAWFGVRDCVPEGYDPVLVDRHSRQQESWPWEALSTFVFYRIALRQCFSVQLIFYMASLPGCRSFPSS